MNMVDRVEFKLFNLSIELFLLDLKFSIQIKGIYNKFVDNGGKNNFILMMRAYLTNEHIEGYF